MSTVTRREVLIELTRIGVKEPYILKRNCRDFEHHMKATYGYEISKKEKKTGQLAEGQPIRIRKRSFCSANKNESP